MDKALGRKEDTRTWGRPAGSGSTSRPLLRPPLARYLARPLADLVALHESGGGALAGDEGEAIARYRRILAAHDIGELTSTERRRDPAELEQLLAETWLYHELEGLAPAHAGRAPGKHDPFAPDTEEPKPLRPDAIDNYGGSPRPEK
jgi:hypothetical protein